MRKASFPALLLPLFSLLLWGQSGRVQFIVTSDSHYGITRASFRGTTNADAHAVNTALVAQMNRIGGSNFPADGGLQSSQRVGRIDFVVDTGDIANRQEQTEGGAIQNAAASWAQFRADYIDGLNLPDGRGGRAPLYVVPGNHDASNSVGSYKPLSPAIDKTSIAGIFNLMMRPSTLKTPATFDYMRDKVLTSRDIGGIHFVFLTLWPDSITRKWMLSDLARVSPATPTIVFAHDPPDSDSKHFINPNGKHDLNAVDGFENLLSDEFEDSRKADAAPLVEQAAWETFVRQHPNVTAYFHGHNNWNQFYDWTGPNHTVALHTFRVDSPMKGHFSAIDETRLSFQIATIDMAARTMTVREVLWNADPKHPDGPVAWGASTTVALAPRLGR